MFVNLCLVAGGLLVGDTTALTRYESTQIHMGTSFKIVLYAADKPSANRAFNAAFARVDQLNSIMSDYDSTSELSHSMQQTTRISSIIWKAARSSAATSSSLLRIATKTYSYRRLQV